eukprot:TRINITY_DN101707_c0_g1_i1.p1 TRINITY_DN101707_c0_g1~~TRINITY_DN101707_c0_g1_i1.p1  ORF type:complete len:592 (+),score=152.36 TRINITY_DN101707_c0_g1_i1:116-1891(+)
MGGRGSKADEGDGDGGQTGCWRGSCSRRVQNAGSPDDGSPKSVASACSGGGVSENSRLSRSPGRNRPQLEQKLTLARARLAEATGNGSVNDDVRQCLLDVDAILNSAQELTKGGAVTSLASALEKGSSSGLAVSSSFKARQSVVHVTAMPTEVRSWLRHSYSNLEEGGDDAIETISRVMNGRGTSQEAVCPVAAHLERCWSLPALAATLRKVGDFDLDLPIMNEVPEFAEQPATVVGMYALGPQGLLGTLPADFLGEDLEMAEFQDRLHKYLNVVDETYLDVIYHNRAHAADVMMMMHWFLGMENMKMIMRPFDHFLALMAAAVHDLAHNGFTNLYHMKTRSVLALRYNDRSPLENMHVSRAFELMNKAEELNWFAMLNRGWHADPEAKAVDLQQTARKTLIEMVLSTDSTLHDGLMKELAPELLDIKSSKDEGVPPSTSPERRLLLLKVLLHAADVSNPTRIQKTMLYFSRRVLLEFWAQGDEEKKLGLEVSPLCEREKGMQTVPQGQIGFVNFVVKPLYKDLCSMLPEVRVALDSMDRNLSFWADKKEANATFDEIFDGSEATDSDSEGSEAVPSDGESEKDEETDNKL